MAQLRSRLNAWCVDVFERVDLLVTPTVPFDPPPAAGPFPSETEGRRQVPAGVAAFTIPFNLSWHPAATVRVGRSRAGLPIGLQIVGRRHRDDLVLRAARAFEAERPGTRTGRRRKEKVGVSRYARSSGRSARGRWARTARGERGRRGQRG
jgi:Asp-tRNA(Asn)/Glu-tRNA(Gln) amidotransferase A subunit family amidase